MNKKAKVAFDDLGVSGKAIVTGTNKLLGTPYEYAKTVGYYNKSYANSPTGGPTKPKGTIKKEEGPNRGYEGSRDDKDFSNFIDNQELEYVRIYDYALLELSRRLLKKLDVEI